MLRTRVRASAAAGVILSLVFALLFTAVNMFDLFVPGWAPQIGQPTAVTLRVPYSPRITRGQGTATTFAYEHVRVRVPRGTVLSEANDDHRAAFANESLRRPPRATKMAALVAINAALVLMLTAYLRTFGHSRMRLLRTQIGILSVMLVTVLVSKLTLLFTGLPEYWVPSAVAALWVALSFDRRTALLVNIVLAILISGLLRYDIFLLFALLTRGMAATVLFFSVKEPRQMIIAGVLAGLSTALIHGALVVAFDGTFPIGADLAAGLDSQLLACVGGGAVGGLLASLLREPAERLLGHVSRDHLFALADLEQPLLQKMAREAPGSWEHSRAMANLAEAAASAIGADALLTRVGAYYHDLGKTTQPKYFVENLAHGEKSPHLELDPDISADAIMAHVVLGTRILREGGIPEPVVEFAYTHHGTQVVEYFWHKYRDMGNPRQLNEDHFRYPGMKPQTKETAILMLVDSIEAASRTIDPPERAKFEAMIERVVFTKLKSGQLDDCGLSLGDLHVLSTRMADTLVNMYHSRIKYPWQKQAEAAVKAAAGGSPDANAPATTPTSLPSPPQGAPTVSATATSPAEAPPTEVEKASGAIDKLPKALRSLLDSHPDAARRGTSPIPSLTPPGRDLPHPLPWPPQGGGSEGGYAVQVCAGFESHRLVIRQTPPPAASGGGWVGSRAASPVGRFACSDRASVSPSRDV